MPRSWRTSILAMTGGQATLSLDSAIDPGAARAREQERGPLAPPARCASFLRPQNELAAHAGRLTAIDKASGGRCVWLLS